MLLPVPFNYFSNKNVNKHKGGVKALGKVTFIQENLLYINTKQGLQKKKKL